MEVPSVGFCLKREMLGWFMTEWIVPDEKGGILYRQEHQDEESTVRSWRFRPKHQAVKRALTIASQLEHFPFTAFSANSTEDGIVMVDGVVYEAWINSEPRIEFYCPHASQDTDIVLLGEEIDALFNISSRRPWFRF